MSMQGLANYNISIHAPAKGATGTERLKELMDYHFNPRSREGSDQILRIQGLKLPFQSTLPRRERHLYLIHKIHGLIISIHAPAKGATVLHQPTKWLREYFNPRSREGSDNKAFPATGFSQKFQSTLPRRERRFHIRLHPLFLLFQSTLPRRERLNTFGCHT